MEDFRAPGAPPRIVPFWFWNCDMTENLVRTQIHQMADAGIGGFFIHPRQGLKIPYLSKEWFARVKFAVEIAKECGLEAWLYDEYPYPSGIAGGLLTANFPEFRARILEHHTLDIAGETAQVGELVRHEFPLGRLVSALACPVSQGRIVWEEAVDIRADLGVVLTRDLFWRWPMAHIPYNEKRFMADEGRLVLSWKPPQEENSQNTSRNWRVFVGIEGEQRGFKYYDCFFDPLRAGAVEEFIRLTHEGYAREMGEHFGATIPGIFTDETEPPGWSPEIERALRVNFGVDLTALLPALRCDDHPRASEVRFAFRSCALRLFQERWEKPIADWCQAHNLIWGAEKPTYRPAQFRGIAQPSTDAGHRRVDLPPEKLSGVDLRANHRAAIAAAEQGGREEVRCECFHSLGWGATLQDQKWQIDWLTVQGVNRFTPHAFYGTSSGLTKHDAAPSFFAENPYWTYFRSLADYTGRLSLAMSCGRERARVALLHPTESLWVRGQNSKAARTEYEWLMNELLAQHHMFHPVDALALMDASACGGALELGRARYETLLVPPLCAVDENTQKAVRIALDAGLKVMMAPPLGSETAFEGAAAMFEWPGIVKIENHADWIEKLGQNRPLSIADENGEQIGEVWALWREAGDQQLIFVANTADREFKAHISVETKISSWENWRLESGEVAPVKSFFEGEIVQITLDLPPFGSALLVGDLAGGNHSDEPISASVVTPKTTILETSGPWSFSVDRPNALRLNRWSIICDTKNWADPTLDDSHLAKIQALPLKFLDQVAHQWVEACPRDANSPIWYRRRVDCDFVPDNLSILVENGAILGDWTLFINGKSVPTNDFSPHSLHGNDKTAARVRDFFIVGENWLVLRVENAPEMGGLRTPLHLIGGFSLCGETQRTLQKMPAEAPFADLLFAGLPHFSGAATYSRDVKLSELGQVIALPHGFQEIVELKINGQSLGVRPWSPYQWEIPDLSVSERASETDSHDETVRLEISVTNTLLPFIEGQFWDAPAHKLRNV